MTSGTTGAGPSGRCAVGDDIVHVWTDGGCLGNPGPMGIGCVVACGEERHELSEFLGDGTNNIAELTAIESGIALARARFGYERTFKVYSDSAYAIGVVSKAWKAKANQELVARIRAYLAELARLGGQVEFVKVRGHAGVAENERCDQLATEAMRAGTTPAEEVAVKSAVALLVASKVESNEVRLAQVEKSVAEILRLLPELEAKAATLDHLISRWEEGQHGDPFDDRTADCRWWLGCARKVLNEERAKRGI